MNRSKRGALGALAVGLAVMTAACSGDSGHENGRAQGSGEAQLREGMRTLWQDHVTWTRVVIISAVAGLPDYEVAVGRLLKNQDDIGEAIKPFYGEAAGTQLTGLLKDHIVIAGELLAVAKSGNSAAQEAAASRWYANADDIAGFLANANPDHWTKADMTRMMRDHLDLTLAEATARLVGDWSGDVAAYDRVVAEIMEMADMLADGIVAQFPEQFA